MENKDKVLKKIGKQYRNIFLTDYKEKLIQ